MKTTLSASSLSRLDRRPLSSSHSVKKLTSCATSSLGSSERLFNSAVPHHLSQSNWQDPAKLQQILAQTRLDRKRLFQVLRQLDHNKTNMVTYSIFIQAAQDNNIVLDEASQDYIVKHRCDKFGMLSYMNIIKDLSIKT